MSDRKVRITMAPPEVCILQDEGTVQVEYAPPLWVFKREQVRSTLGSSCLDPANAQDLKSRLISCFGLGGVHFQTALRRCPLSTRRILW